LAGQGPHQALMARMRPATPTRVKVRRIGDVSNLGRKREDHVDVFDRQQVVHPSLHPVLCRSTLALRAIPIAARVIGDVLMITFCASRNVTAERCRAAILNRRHYLQLWQVQVPGMVMAIRRPMGA